jgi:hypothetical protein
MTKSGPYLAVNFMRPVESQTLGYDRKQREPTTSQIKLKKSSRSSDPVIQVEGRERTYWEGPSEPAFSRNDGILVAEVG